MLAMAIGSSPGKWLIEHQQVGLVDERGDQLHALLVSVGEGVKAVAGPAGEAEPLQPGVDGPVHVPGCLSAQLAQVAELVPHPHAGIQAALFRHVPEPCPLPRPDRCPPPAQPAGVQFDQPEHGPHRGGLARAVGAQEAREPPGLDGEGAAVERCQPTKALGRTVKLEHDFTSTLPY
jgi:hypothetical protein